MNIYEKLKIFKKNSFYANFLFTYPSSYIINKLPLSFFDLKEIKQDSLLYIHIPFCIEICKFCNVYKEKIWSKEQLNLYLETLKKEIIFFWKKCRDVNIVWIYIWWWTPSLLNSKDLENLFTSIKKNFNFKKDIYYEIDAYPITINESKLKILKKYWVNHISLWIQSMDKKVLDNVNRFSNDKKLLEKLASLFKKYKFNLHFDFIVWLPWEKFDKLTEDLKYIITTFQAKSISINWYDNTLDTILYKDYKLKYKDKDYLKEIDENKNKLIYILEKKYNIFRKKTYYFDEFQSKHKNIIWIWAWAFGFVKNFWVYRNLLLKDYVENNNFENKYIYKLDKYEEKLMFLIHNYWSSTFNNDYKKLFYSNFVDDFWEKIKYFIEKWLIKVKWKKVFFNFKNNKIALFELISLYPDNILKYYT